jgi:DNA-binding transcriptional LysR family regulator
MPVTERSLFSRRLLFEQYVVACNSDHPWTRRPFSLEDYLKADHLTVRPANVALSEMEKMFAEKQFKLRPTLQVPHFLVIGSVLRNTNLVATIPAYVAAFLKEQMPLAIFDLPMEQPSIPVNLLWHARHQRDIASGFTTPVFNA